MIDINRLKKLAEDATPGPWCWDKGENPRPNTYGIATDADEEQMVVNQEFGIELKEDVYFIAAANPATVLELIAEIERLNAENQTLREKAGCVDDCAHLIRKLVHCRRQLATDGDLAEKALDYLKRKGLQGSPLRGEADHG